MLSITYRSTSLIFKTSSIRNACFFLFILCNCRDFIDIMNWCMKKKWRRHVKWVDQQVGHHIGRFSSKPFHNCSMFSSYSSSHWACSQMFSQVCRVANSHTFFFWHKIEITTNIHVFFVCCIHTIHWTDILKSDANFWVPDNIYVSVLCFLTFNVSAMLGSLTTSWVQWVRHEKSILDLEIEKKWTQLTRITI